MNDKEHHNFLNLAPTKKREILRNKYVSFHYSVACSGGAPNECRSFYPSDDDDGGDAGVGEDSFEFIFMMFQSLLIHSFERSFHVLAICCYYF